MFFFFFLGGFLSFGWFIVVVGILEKCIDGKKVDGVVNDWYFSVNINRY